MQRNPMQPILSFVFVFSLRFIAIYYDCNFYMRNFLLFFLFFLFNYFVFRYTRSSTCRSEHLKKKRLSIAKNRTDQQQQQIKQCALHFIHFRWLSKKREKKKQKHTFDRHFFKHLLLFLCACASRVIIWCNN